MAWERGAFVSRSLTRNSLPCTAEIWGLGDPISLIEISIGEDPPIRGRISLVGRFRYIQQTFIKHAFWFDLTAIIRQKLPEHRKPSMKFRALSLFGLSPRCWFLWGGGQERDSGDQDRSGHRAPASACGGMIGSRSSPTTRGTAPPLLCRLHRQSPSPLRTRSPWSPLPLSFGESSRPRLVFAALDMSIGGVMTICQDPGWLWSFIS